MDNLAETLINTGLKEKVSSSAYSFIKYRLMLSGGIFSCIYRLFRTIANVITVYQQLSKNVSVHTSPWTKCGRDLDNA